MANIKFTQLPNLGTITANTIVPVVSAGVNYTVTTANLQTYVNANIVSNNISAGVVSATGNITGAYFLGNGSQLTGLPATYANANVVTLLANFGSNTVSTTGNVTTGNITSTTITGTSLAGNGSALSNLTAANVIGNVATAVFASTAGTAAIANTAATAVSATTASTVTGNAQGNITSVGTLTGLNVTGNVVVYSGNVTADYFLGNGSQLTGVVSSYGNSNVSTLLANFGSNTISTTGNITSGAIISGNVYTEFTGNIAFSGSVTPVYTSGSVQKFTATSNFTLNAPTGMPTGGSVTLIITQDATGSRIMTANAAYKFAYAVRTLSTTPNAIDVMSIFYDGTNYLCNLVKGYA